MEKIYLQKVNFKLIELESVKHLILYLRLYTKYYTIMSYTLILMK